MSADSALLLGYDVNGFTAEVERAYLLHGRHAGERAAGALIAGGEAIVGILGEAGFAPLDSIGDGALYLRPGAAPDRDEMATLAKLQLQIERVHYSETGLSIRSAFAVGSLQFLSLPNQMVRQASLIWGDAIEQIHARLNDKSVRKHVPILSSTKPLSGTPQDQHARILEETCMYVRLYDAIGWRLLDPERVIHALGSISHWVGALGGRTECIRHDDKGIHARLSLARRARSTEELEAGLKSLVEKLSRLGLPSAASLESGVVYRGADTGTTAIVHGPAVNRAAKRLARCQNGEISISDEDRDEWHSSGAALSLDQVLGRASETKAISSWLEGESAKCVILSGSPGVGKSHLAEWIRSSRATDKAHAIWLRCGTQTQFSAFNIARTLLASLLEQALLAGEFENAAQFLDYVFNAATLPEVWRSTCSAILETTPEDRSEAESVDPAQRVYVLQRFLVQAAAELAARSPFMAVIDDAHLMDVDSADAIAAMLDLDQPIQLLMTCRNTPGVKMPPNIVQHPASLVLPVDPLSDTAIADIVRTIEESASDQLVADVVHLACGNPFFAIQTTLALCKNPVAKGGSVEEILSDRLSTLSPDEMSVLRAATLFDYPADAQTVASLLARPGEAGLVGDIIGALARHQLVRPSRSDTGQIVVSHDLIGATVRLDTPQSVAQTLSRSSARWMQRQGIQMEDLPRQASYWLAAGETARAALLFGRSARRSADQGFYRQAADLYGRALNLWDAKSIHAKASVHEWRAARAEALFALGEFQDANVAANHCLSHIETRPRNERVRAALARAAAMQSETGYYAGNLRDMVGSHWTIFRATLTQREAMLAQGRSFVTLGYMFGLMRMNWMVDMLLRSAQRLGEKHGDQRPLSYTLAAKAYLALSRCQWKEGEEALHQAMQCMDGWETDHNWLETLETSFGLFAAMQGHGDRARDHFDRLKQSATQRGHRLHEGWAEYSIASALINEGQYEAAYHPLDRGRALIVGTGDLQSVHICEGLSARLHWGLNDHSAALRIADSAGKLSKQMRPTNFSSLEAFGAPPLVGALAMLKGGTTAEAGVKLVENYLGPLKRYATVFPSAKPRLATVNAIAAVARKSGNAAALTDKAAEMAERCGMRFEANILSRALPHLASI